ncbi:fibroblast growth factor receptor [Lingula anatina]|uniref:Fibroblast growth factor receptor n=1 Tax=Lingula anatina TaxID=7574 RepID=A0A1S3IKP6_LINAN|nr:fibroblast growth factor receptor [Lingula anatina]|eukprot:XP_013398663.1 fibroblast growth factor receptor [Lingula anatina]
MAFHMRTSILILGVIILITPACGIMEVLVPENAPSLQMIDEGDPFSIWCNFSMALSTGFTVIWKKVNPLNSTDIRPIYMLLLAGMKIAKPMNEFIGRNISVTYTLNPNYLFTINCLIRIYNASYWDGGNYTCSVKLIGVGVSATSEEYQTVRVIVNSTRIVPKSQEKFGYFTFWPILLLAAALFLGFLIIVVIVYNRRKVAFRAVHLPRQNTPTNIRRRRDVRRPGKTFKLPIIRFINRFRKGNTDDYHMYEVPERVEENQRNTYITLNESAQELNLNDIELLQNIGHGHFGEVFKAILKTTNAAVAVKLLKEQYTEVDKRDFFREIDTMQLVPQHENMVVMLGFCKSAVRAFLVLEYLGNGNLKTYLHKSRSHNTYSNLHGGSSELTSRNILSYALDSAKGMAHISRYKVGQLYGSCRIGSAIMCEVI